MPPEIPTSDSFKADYRQRIFESSIVPSHLKSSFVNNVDLLQRPFADFDQELISGVMALENHASEAAENVQSLLGPDEYFDGDPASLATAILLSRSVAETGGMESVVDSLRRYIKKRKKEEEKKDEPQAGDGTPSTIRTLSPLLEREDPVAALPEPSQKATVKRSSLPGRRTVTSVEDVDRQPASISRQTRREVAALLLRARLSPTEERGDERLSLRLAALLGLSTEATLKERLADVLLAHHEDRSVREDEPVMMNRSFRKPFESRERTAPVDPPTVPLANSEIAPEAGYPPRPSRSPSDRRDKDADRERVATRDPDHQPGQTEPDLTRGAVSMESAVESIAVTEERVAGLNQLSEEVCDLLAPLPAGGELYVFVTDAEPAAELVPRPEQEHFQRLALAEGIKRGLRPRLGAPSRELVVFGQAPRLFRSNALEAGPRDGQPLCIIAERTRTRLSVLPNGAAVLELLPAVPAADSGKPLSLANGPETALSKLSATMESRDTSLIHDHEFHLDGSRLVGERLAAPDRGADSLELVPDGADQSGGPVHLRDRRPALKARAADHPADGRPRLFAAPDLGRHPGAAKRPALRPDQVATPGVTLPSETLASSVSRVAETASGGDTGGTTEETELSPLRHTPLERVERPGESELLMTYAEVPPLDAANWIPEAETAGQSSAEPVTSSV